MVLGSVRHDKFKISFVTFRLAVKISELQQRQGRAIPMMNLIVDRMNNNNKRARERLMASIARERKR
jgi:predicted transcriptional regulator